MQYIKLFPDTILKMKSAPEYISKMQDAFLVDLYKKDGSLEILGELYSRYMPLVYGVCLKYLREQQASEDAVMQIFEELVEKVRKHDIREFRTWLWAVARNHCLGIIRKDKANSFLEIRPEVMESDALLHLLDKKDDEAKLRRLEDCLERLPEPQKVSVRLFFYEDKSYADICDRTEYNLKSVKSYIQNGKRNLKNCMEAQAAPRG
ncbi:MAG: sigma-70 family RNA polymerase sigma factor [Alistipes sp.]|nr:sigma-70 family RNA polymerase sigma factor [Alistipes sp.]